MSDGYQSPAAQAWGQQRAQEAAQAEARSRPREDWTDLTFEEFQKLSGTERNQLYRSDQSKYAQMQGHA